MGDATEALARFLGPTVGGLLNATLGNAPEIIISSFALHAGLVDMVKSSLTGSILGNLLFGLGVSFFVGGIKFRRDQTFDPKAARMTTALLTLASFGLIVPAMTQFNASASRSISRETAVVLFVVYLASLVAIFANRKADDRQGGGQGEPQGAGGAARRGERTGRNPAGAGTRPWSSWPR